MTACAGCTGRSNEGAAAGGETRFSDGGGASADVALGGFVEAFFLLCTGACRWTGASSATIAFQSAETDAASATRSKGSTSAVARASRSVVESEGLATAESSTDAGGAGGSDDIFFDSCGVPREVSARGFRHNEDEAVFVR